MENLSLKAMFQGIKTDTTQIIKGVVLAVNPLKIQAINDEKLILNENLLIVPSHLKDYKTSIDIKLSGGFIDSSTENTGAHYHDEGLHDQHVSGNGSHVHNGGEHFHKLSTFNIETADITVYNALKVSDMVYLLGIGNDKRYYVLDRE